MKIQETQEKYPNFYDTANYLQNKTFFFKKSLPKLIQTNFNFELAERLCKTGLNLFNNDQNLYYKKLDELIDMSLRFLKLQIKLEKTGKYLYSSFDEVKEDYAKNVDNEGPDYLWGLYFSEIFWKIHHGFTNFFLKDFLHKEPETGLVLEIPCGTGFFMTEFLRINPEWHAVGVDLEDASINFTRNILKANNISTSSYTIIKDDFFKYQPKEKFDKIICGEFLEHLEDPLSALKKLSEMLKDDGKIFLTAAVWAAHIDHIYLYEKPQEVRDQIIEANLRIEKELVQSVFEKEGEEMEKGKIPISYAAILIKNK